MDDIFGIGNGNGDSDFGGIMPMFISIMMMGVIQSFITPPAPAKTLVSITITGNASLVYDPSQPSGTTQQLHVIGMYDDSSTADLTTSAALTTSDTSVAIITPLGVLAAVGVGSAVITATIGTLVATFNVTVTASTPGRIIVDITWD